MPLGYLPTRGFLITYYAVMPTREREGARKGEGEGQGGRRRPRPNS